MLNILLFNKLNKKVDSIEKIPIFAPLFGRILLLNLN